MKGNKFTSILLITFMLASGMSFSQNFQNKFFKAAKKGDKEKLVLYLGKGVPIDSRAKNNSIIRKGATALMVASERGHLDIVNILLEKGADITIKLINLPLSYELKYQKQFGTESPIYTAMFYAEQSGKIEIVERLKLEQDKLFFNNAIIERKANIFDDYMKKFPNGKFLIEARQISDSLSFEDALAFNNLSSSHHYISNFPNGTFINEVKLKFDSLIRISLVKPEKVSKLLKKINTSIIPFKIDDINENCFIDIDNDQTDNSVIGNFSEGKLTANINLSGNLIFLNSDFKTEGKDSTTYIKTQIGKEVDIYCLPGNLSTDELLKLMNEHSSVKQDIVLKKIISKDFIGTKKIIKVEIENIDKVLTPSTLESKIFKSKKYTHLINFSGPVFSTYNKGIKFNKITFYKENGCINECYYILDGKWYYN